MAPQNFDANRMLSFVIRKLMVDNSYAFSTSL